jgi:hypothetical protein
MQGWSYAPSEAQFIAYWERDNEIRDHAKQKAAWQPLPRPWGPVKKAPVMGDDRRARLRKHAKSMTGGRR